jgi:transcriptional regulator with XRE-family HTH domain
MQRDIDRLMRSENGASMFRQESFIIEVTDFIISQMKRRGISRKQLAEKLDRSKGRVSQMLDGESNLTLRTLSDIFAAMDLKPVVTVQPLRNFSFEGTVVLDEDFVRPAEAWKLPRRWPEGALKVFQQEQSDHALAG